MGTTVKKDYFQVRITGENIDLKTMNPKDVATFFSETVYFLEDVKKEYGLPDFHVNEVKSGSLAFGLSSENLDFSFALKRIAEFLQNDIMKLPLKLFNRLKDLVYLLDKKSASLEIIDESSSLLTLTKDIDFEIGGIPVEIEEYGCLLSIGGSQKSTVKINTARGITLTATFNPDEVNIESYAKLLYQEVRAIMEGFLNPVSNEYYNLKLVHLEEDGITVTTPESFKKHVEHVSEGLQITEKDILKMKELRREGIIFNIEEDEDE